MKLIAHRGIYNKDIKENSYESVLKALKSDKYIGVEFDIRETLDQKIILYHNILYKGNLVSKTYYKYFESITLLESILKINTDKILLIEIKDRHINLKRLIKLLNKYKRNYYIMSFHKQVIYEMKRLEPIYKYGVLNYVLNSEDDYDLDFICLLDIIASDIVIESFKKRKIDVIIYGTISTKKDVIYIVDEKNIKERLN